MNVNAVQHVFIVLILILVCLYMDLATDLSVLYIDALLHYDTSVLSGLRNFINSTA